MKGTKTFGKGVNGIKVELSLNELIALSRVANKVALDAVEGIEQYNHENKDGNLKSTPTLVLAQFVLKITEDALDIDTTIQNMIEGDNIFKEEGKDYFKEED